VLSFFYVILYIYFITITHQTIHFHGIKQPSTNKTQRGVLTFQYYTEDTINTNLCECRCEEKQGIWKPISKKIRKRKQPKKESFHNHSQYIRQAHCRKRLKKLYNRP